MYKILLADNEGVVLDSLIHLIYGRYGEACDIRVAKTPRYTRVLARKFIPDIAIINVQMPGMHGFDVVREIRSYHLKCVFITFSSAKRSLFRTEAENLHILRHLTKPLFREKILPVLEDAITIVNHSQKMSEQNHLIQEKFDQVIPLLEHGMISQMFFSDGAAEHLEQYRQFLNIPQTYGKVVTLTFGEGAETDGLQNQIGSSIRLQKEYRRFRETVREHFPLAIVGPVMGNHVALLQPCWKETATSREEAEFSSALQHLVENLTETFDGLTFCAACSPTALMSELHI